MAGLLRTALLLLVLLTPTHQPNLTLEQQVAQMFMVTIHGAQLPETGRDFLQRWQPGAIVLFNSNIGSPAAITRLTNSYQQAITAVDGVPLFIAVDQEGGRVQRLLEGFTTLPRPILVAATQDPQLAHNYGGLIAEELRAVGVNMNLAPVADLETNPDNPIIRQRAYGSDPHLTGTTLQHVVAGMQANGVLATLKHFPGHGESDQDSHVELPTLPLSRERLSAVELVPFQMAANAEAVMVAHIWFPALEPEANLPASLSHNIVTGILRDELGYEGLILTDAMDMDAIDRQFSYERAAVMAIQAGVDMIAMGPGMGLETQAAMIQAVIDAVRTGEIAESRIAESSQRILATKARYGLFDWSPLDEAATSDRLDLESHQAQIETLFNAGITLVYDDQQLIPLHAERSVAVVFLGTRQYTVSACDPHRDNIRWVGVSQYPTLEEIRWAMDAARQVDTIVVFTENADDNEAQQALVSALPPEKTVVVALASAYDWTRFPTIAAYLTAYSPLPAAVPAACGILFGAIPAQGVLPLTVSPDLSAGTRAD